MKFVIFMIIAHGQDVNFFHGCSQSPPIPLNSLILKELLTLLMTFYLNLLNDYFNYKSFVSISIYLFSRRTKKVDILVVEPLRSGFPPPRPPIP